MKFFTLIFSFLLSAGILYSQTARVQVIHNSPSPVVDVYANGALLLDNFEFRTATPYISVDADVPIELAVAPGNSASADDAIATFPVQFEDGKTYSVIANGVVGNPNTPFKLTVFDAAREMASDMGNVDVLVFHGSPDAPAVDVDAVFVGNLLSNLSYDAFSNGYLSIPADKYFLQVRPAGVNQVVATFDADLSGAGGASVTVFASGFLNTTPGFGLFAALPNGDVIELPINPGAALQVIHNSPSPTVDVYVNAALVLDDFEYRTATPFLQLPAGSDLEIAIAPGNSTSVNDQIANFTVNLDAGKSYVAVAAGIVGDANNPFNLFLTDMGRRSGSAPDKVDVMVFHGAAGAPAVDVSEAFEDNIIENLAFGNFTGGYLSLDPDTYFLEIKPNGSRNLVGTYFVNLTNAGGLPLVVFASGNLGGGEPLDLFAALPNGGVVRLLPVSLAQIIHNSPAAIASTVDLYANDGLLADDLSFRESTGITYLPSRTNFDIGVAGANSTSVDDVLITIPGVSFEDGKSYTIIANGIPGDQNTPFELKVFDQTRVLSDDDTKVDVLVFHGAPNAPAVDVNADGIGNLIDNLSYGEFADDYLSVDPGNYFLQIFPEGSDDLVATYLAQLGALDGIGLTVFASGLLGGTPAFGLYAALFDGTVVPLASVTKVQVIHNSADPTVDVYANGNLLLDDFAYRSATSFGYYPTNTAINLAVAPGNSTTVDDAIFNKSVTLEDGKYYILMATGLVGDANTPFDLAAFDNGREATKDPGKVSLLVYHGSTDAPEVDVVVNGGPVLIDDLEYGEFQGYAEVDALNYQLDITPANDNSNVVASYGADLSGLGGGAATVFASGFFDGTDPAFGIWVALPDGTTFPLQTVVSNRDIENQVLDFTVAPNPVRDQARIDFNLTENTRIQMDIVDVQGRHLKTLFTGVVPAGANNQVLQAGDLNPGYYYIMIRTDKGMIAKSFSVIK